MNVPLLGLNAQHEPPRNDFVTAMVRVLARPVFVDIDLVTYNLNPSRSESAITSRTREIIPVPLHRQECLHTLGYVDGDSSEAERACRKMLSLPIYPELNEDQQHYVVQTVRVDLAQ